MTNSCGLAVDNAVSFIDILEIPYFLVVNPLWQGSRERYPGCHGSKLDRLVQERRNSSALAMELRLSCTNLSNLHCGVPWMSWSKFHRLVLERRNSSALAMELRISCTNLSNLHCGVPWMSWSKFNRLVQERRNSSALAMELHLSCTNPSIYFHRI